MDVARPNDTAMAEGVVIKTIRPNDSKYSQNSEKEREISAHPIGPQWRRRFVMAVGTHVVNDLLH